MPSTPNLTPIIRAFYEKLFNDIMVSFLFNGVDREHLVQTQTRFIESVFDSTKKYTGKSPATAHRHLPILPGHFDRRLKILKETLDEFGVPDDMKKKWISVEKSFRRKILNK